jgi:DNA-binding NtrC family response regulator
MSSSAAGTGFTLWLPAVEARVEREPVVITDEMPVARTAETVLVVEDEAMVRTLVVRILARAGFNVVAAANGEEAIAIAAAHEGPIALVVTDVVMPKMGGQKLVEQLRIARPSTRVLMMSGHAADVEDRERIIAEETPFLQKPFRPEQLLRKVREVLDGVV